MKKVWILEKLYLPEETKQSITEMEEMLENLRNNPEAPAEGISCMENTISTLKQRLADFPEGYWLGFEGKVIYRQFCQVAKAAINRNPGCTFRVVSAEIADDAKFWLGYQNPTVNEGVLKYLMATR